MLCKVGLLKERGMKKTLIYIVFFITNIAFIYPNYAIANINNRETSYFDKDTQFTSKDWQLVKHSFRFHLPQKSKPLSQIIITIPSTVAVSNDIDVLEQTGRKIDINISVIEGKIVLVFPSPVAPNTKFNINLNKVKQPVRGPASKYQFSAKFVGNDAEIPIGVVQFSTN